ncbi:hypothetical protein BT69DRAFT_1348991 [Atractiella rhizophila]|nr:hypothetical protein BT69DRAFT_1348991 [Atractiella rhizophila]
MWVRNRLFAHHHLAAARANEKAIIMISKLIPPTAPPTPPPDLSNNLSYCRESGCNCPVYEAPAQANITGTRCDLCEHELYWHHRRVSLSAVEISKAMAATGHALEHCKSKECRCPVWVGDNGALDGEGTNCFLCGHKLGWHKASVDRAKERECNASPSDAPKNKPLPMPDFNNSSTSFLSTPATSMRSRTNSATSAPTTRSLLSNISSASSSTQSTSPPSSSGSIRSLPSVDPQLIGYPASPTETSSIASSSASIASAILDPPLPNLIGYPASIASSSSSVSVYENLPALHPELIGYPPSTTSSGRSNATSVYRNHPALHPELIGYPESSHSSGISFPRLHLSSLHHRSSHPPHHPHHHHHGTYPPPHHHQHHPHQHQQHLGHFHEEFSDSYHDEFYHSESEEEEDHTQSLLTSERLSSEGTERSRRRVRKKWSTHGNMRVQIQVSPPLKITPVSPGQKIDCRVRLVSNKVSLANYKKLEVILIGICTVSGDPPEHHPFVTVLKSILPRTSDVRGDGPEDREWTFRFTVPAIVTCACQGELHSVPPSFLHNDIQVHYRMELRGERKELLKAKDRTIIPVTLKRAVDVPDPLLAHAVHPEVGYDGNWTYSRLSTRASVPVRIAVEGQTAPIVDAEIAYEIHSCKPLLIHYRFSLSFPPSSHLNNDSMSKIKSKLRIALSRRIILKNLITGKESVRPTLRVKSLVQRTEDELVRAQEATIWRVEGRVIVQEEDICVWKACNGEVRYFLSCHVVNPAILSTEIGLLVPIKDFAARSPVSELDRRTNVTDHSSDHSDRYTYHQESDDDHHHSLREWEESGFDHALKFGELRITNP